MELVGERRIMLSTEGDCLDFDFLATYLGDRVENIFSFDFSASTLPVRLLTTTLLSFKGLTDA